MRTLYHNPTDCQIAIGSCAMLLKVGSVKMPNQRMLEISLLLPDAVQGVMVSGSIAEGEIFDQTR